MPELYIMDLRSRMALVHNMHSILLNQDRLVYLKFYSIYCSGRLHDK